MKILIIFCVILVMATTMKAQQNNFPKLTGPYLDHKPPGMTAQLFAPGIVSTEYFEHSSPVFTPDLKEIYWSTQIEKIKNQVEKPILCMKMINGVWTKPEVPSFAKMFHVAESPFITPDGKRLLFWTIRDERFEIYYVDRVGDGWSEPNNLDHTEMDKVTPSVSKEGTIYFHGLKKDGLYYSKLVNGKYQQPVFMEGQFYSGETEGTPYIAPDESYLIFSSFRKGGFGSGDLYISFKQKDGNWGNIINMGEKVNTTSNERFPNVTPDGKYLFFNSTRKIDGAPPNSPGNGQGDVYWIDVKIINELKPKEQQH